MKITVQIGRIRVRSAQPVDRAQLYRQISAALERKLASPAGEWRPASAERLRLDAGRSRPAEWGELVAGAIAKTGRQP